MKWKVVTVGRPALAYARTGAEEYLRRLKRLADVEWVTVKEGDPGVVTARMLRASEGCLRICLDERGEIIDTQAFVRRIEAWERDSVKAVALLVGGADGHQEALREKADTVLALGRMTLQHELALVVALEQLYRVQTVKKNMPYHR